MVKASVSQRKVYSPQGGSLILKRGNSKKDSATVAEWSRYRIVAGFVTSSNPVPLKTRRVGVRSTLNLPRAETSSGWCGS
ncbi:hypothetical protein TNCV_180401 [Trichonephila clavipes]|nr:hypothetical protein TNCV_180401 [Trichonephila clavipes]